MASKSKNVLGKGTNPGSASVKATKRITIRLIGERIKKSKKTK